MTSNNHDTLVYRLTQILIKLNQGQRLNPKDLAAEFGVTLRTMQRDLNERFNYLPLEKVDGCYRLDPRFLGQLTTKDIERFAGLAGVRGLFPALSDQILRELFDSRVQSGFLVQGHHYEDLSERGKDFTLIEKAIRQRNFLSFTYLKGDALKSYVEVAPYRLINSKGIWYLAATDQQNLKTFSFTKISRLEVSAKPFEWDSKVEAQVSGEDSIWFAEEKQIIRLSIDAKVASYFERRKLVPQQEIVQKSEDGSIELTCSVAHLTQIFPIIRYWIPYVRVLEPAGLQEEVNEELRRYLATFKK